MPEAPLSLEECAVGQVLAGRYRVEGLIGTGSMGVVVAATHLGFDELVALKFIRPEMRHLEGIVARFAREAKASVRVRNAHAVNVLDVGVTDPIGPFFAMEYLWGSNLEELIDARGPLSVATATNYVLSACEALAAAHAQGIIHRDIKPQNMFLARQGTLESLKLLDFGISKAPLRGQVFGDDLSAREQDWVMGTPMYMSPEQLRHEPDLDERTDIWSLGTVLYELLTGEPRYAGDTHSQVAREILVPTRHESPIALWEVPDELCQVIERCLAQDRRERFANVAELAAALAPFAPPSARLHVERAMALLGVLVTEVPDDEIEDLDVAPFEELPPPPRPRRRRWAELSALALVCVVAALGWGYMGARGGSETPPAPRAMGDIRTEQLALEPRQIARAPEARPVVPRPSPAPAPLVEPPALGSAPPRAPAPETETETRRPLANAVPPAKARATTASGVATAAGGGPRAAAPRRLIRSKPAAPPTFRLIAEQPRSGLALLPAKPPPEVKIQLVPPK